MRYLIYFLFLNIVFMDNNNISENGKDFSYIGNWPINKNKISII